MVENILGALFLVLIIGVSWFLRKHKPDKEPAPTKAAAITPLSSAAPQTRKITAVKYAQDFFHVGLVIVISICVLSVGPKHLPYALLALITFSTLMISWGIGYGFGCAVWAFKKRSRK